ncbi:kinase-like domain-containing protein [Flammula alnicola]|nr:kinase-like domain-containing protein [Flammula alnicola]
MSTSPSASPSYTGATIASESSSGESSPAHGASTSNEASNHSSSQSSSNGANAKGSSNNVNNHNTSRSNTPPSAPLQPVPKKEFTDELLTIVSRLGEGAGGAVHRVLDMRDGMTYARKTITTRDSTSVRQVVRELSIISGTRHRNIVLCYGAYMSPSSSEVKIVMEYCDGKSLEAVGAKLREVKAVIGEKIAGRIAEGVLQGLAYLHTKKTIHRDIKPSNILLSREGIVKLCDFGVSGELVNSIVGTFTGTLIYMAPERVSGQEYTVRSDVWSTGISLLELVQNRFPFPSNLPTIELILMITTGEPPKLEDEPEAGVTWSDEMKDFIGQTLIRDAALRPTPEQMLVHPWIVNTMKQDVHMARWIRQVWGWAKARKGRRSDTTDSIAAVGGADAEDSRPSTAGGGSRERQRRDSESPLEG